MTDSLPYCPGGTLDGATEWVIWYAGAAATAGIGALGLLQTGGADPLTRAPFGVMIATALACLFPVGGDLALLGYALAHGQALATWLGSTMALDDMLDRCNTLREMLWLRHACQVALATTALLHLSLSSNPSSDAMAAWLALQVVLWTAQAGILVTFRQTARRQLLAGADEAEEADGPPGTVDTVLRSMDVAAGASLVAAGGVVALVAIDRSHDRGDPCGEFAIVQSIASVPVFAAVFYAVAAVTALRAEAKQSSMRWTLWRGLVPIRADPQPPTAEP
jgi:hypothetical protein